MEKEIVRLEKAEKYYDPVGDQAPFKALEDITLSITAGSFTCIVGESGCGKTTLLRLIAGLDQPSKGTVMIDEKPVTGPSEKCGMVFQQPTLFPWLTVYQNIAFGPKRIGRYQGNEAEIDELIQMISLDPFANSYPGQLSGGMRQRVALARALANKPEIMLLDEPLSALDAFSRMHLQEELLRLWKMRNNTLIMVTHDVDEAIYLADTIVVMTPHPGRIHRVVSNDMPYPRDRTSPKFVKLRNELLKFLNFAGNTAL